MFWRGVFYCDCDVIPISFIIGAIISNYFTGPVVVFGGVYWTNVDNVEEGVFGEGVTLAGDVDSIIVIDGVISIDCVCVSIGDVSPTS